MKPYLLYPENTEYSCVQMERDNYNALIQDLNLHVIFRAMAGDDTYLYNTVSSIVLNSITDLKVILYRQHIIQDWIQSKSTIALIGSLYKLAGDVLSKAVVFREYAKPSFARIIPVSARVMNAVALLELLANNLEEMVSLLRQNVKYFRSNGMVAFYTRLLTVLTDEFFAKVKQHIVDLKSVAEGGKLIIESCIGYGMKGTGHVLRKVINKPDKTETRRNRLNSATRYVISLDNSSLANSAREIEDAGLIQILKLLNAFNGKILNFFEAFRYEAGFYYGCTKLYSVLAGLNAQLSFPVPDEMNKRSLIFEGLYDLSLLINEKRKIVSNDLNAANKTLFIVTGANQGGKSTYLRSIGIAQMLMQCGMFVPAGFYRSNVSDRIFTHFTREEDAGMSSGKLDEELYRMNSIINEMTKASLILMNESFASTTEREGSRIVTDIINTFLDNDIKVIFVTHLYEFADGMYRRGLEQAVFLQAERNDDGRRSFRIRMGEPLRTSYGMDLFESILELENHTPSPGANPARQEGFTGTVQECSGMQPPCCTDSR